MAAPVITTHQIYQARPGIVFKQYVGNAAIAQHPDLKPGDVLVDIESKTVSYIGEDNVHLPWTGVTTAKETRHPTIQPHYILVPLQRRFSWLSHTGYQHWYHQAIDFNPGDHVELYVEQIKRATVASAYVGDPMDLDADAEGVTDYGDDVEPRDLEADDIQDLIDDAPPSIPSIAGSGDEDSDGAKSIFNLTEATLKKRITQATDAQRKYVNPLGNDTANGKDKERLIHGRAGSPEDGAEFPADTKKIYWKALDVWTYLPFSGTADVTWIRSLNEVSTPNQNCIVQLDFRINTTSELTNKIRDACAMGNAVMINNWFPRDSAMDFDVASVSTVRDILGGPAEWQDAILRDREYRGKLRDGRGIHRSSGLAEMIARSIDHRVCGNTLDLPNIDGVCPPFIRALSDDIAAFERTRYTYCGVEPKGKDVFGPQVVAYDFVRSRLWDLVTHAGFLTYAHHDANGYHTWTTPQSGAKIWIIIRPKDSDTGVLTRAQLHTLYDKLINNLGRIPDEFEVCIILLEPGQVIIMPPGMWHLVYTPVGGMTSGGHFLTYDTMHLTYASRTFDDSQMPGADKGVTRSVYSTNEAQSIDRQILRMVLALPYAVHGSVKFRRRPLIAMMLMVRNVQGAGMTRSDSPLVKKGDLLYQEVQGEKKRALIICEKIRKELELSWVDIEEELDERPSDGWDAPEEEIDLEFLKDTKNGAM